MLNKNRKPLGGLLKLQIAKQDNSINEDDNDNSDQQQTNKQQQIFQGFVSGITKIAEQRWEREYAENQKNILSDIQLFHQFFKYQEKLQIHINLLQKLTSNRTYQDISILKAYFKTLNFINKIAKNCHEYQLTQILDKFTKQICYEYVPKGSTVYKYGDTRIAFFLILDGKCTSLIRKSEKQIDEEYFAIFGKQRSQMYSAIQEKSSPSMLMQDQIRQLRRGTKSIIQLDSQESQSPLRKIIKSGGLLQQQIKKQQSNQISSPPKNKNSPSTNSYQNNTSISPQGSIKKQALEKKFTINLMKTNISNDNKDSDM